MPGQDETVPGEQPAAGYFSVSVPERYSVNSAVELDFSAITRDFLDGLSKTGERTGLGDGRQLLPPDYIWSRDGKTRAPMALCELVAYKTALAYEDEAEIRASVGGAPHVGFFDSSRVGLADTQGFAFIQDGMAFVVMRGTEKGTDWTTNLQHQLTDELKTPRREKLAKELRKHHGDTVLPLLEGLAAKPGRHLGFAIGWAAVHDEIAAHLAAHCPPGMPVVLGGHSLGGALALIGALELKRAGHDVAAVITFGAPQAGNDVFSREYAAAGLSERTVLFEAQGDSVPRLLRRWYYRLHSSLRGQLVGFLTPGHQALPRAQYAVAGNPWTFLAQPALSAREVKDAVKHILDAREQRAKEERERQEKAERPTGASAAGETPATPAGPTSTSQASPSAPAPQPGTGATRAPQGSAQGPEPSGAQMAWIIGAIVVLVLLLTLWLFVRSKRAAHAIIERYALFLSTLSYQHIRVLRAGEPGPAGDRLSLANDDLSRYLRFIRGEGTYIAKAKVADLPVRLEADLDLATFLSEPKNII
jgi:pimeloyl-ACP methyl ester carboxylesterase